MSQRVQNLGIEIYVCDRYYVYTLVVLTFDT